MLCEQSKCKYLHYLAISFVNLLVWFPSLFIKFMNDDHQVVLWIIPKSFADVLRPIWEPYIIDFYWRPLPAVANTAAIFAFGSNPVVLHILSLAVYILVCILLYKLLIKLELSTETSFVAALLFAVIPSHEMPVAWLSARNDTIAAAFILLSVIFFLKLKETGSYNIRLFFILSMIAAFISKEASFPLILLFPIYNIYVLGKEKKSFDTYRVFLIGSLVIGLLFLYRWLVIESHSLLSSSNLDSFGAIDSIFNLAAYLLLSFIDAGMLESIYLLTKENPGFSIPIFLFSLTLIIISIIKIKVNNRRLLIFGLLWFLAFALPALPLLGRWYAFIPSLGLFVSIAVLYDSINKLYFKRVIAVLLIVFSSVLSYSKMTEWVDVSNKTESACLPFGKYDYTDVRTITLLGVPNKIDGINSMRIGVQETVHYFCKGKHTDVLYPLKTEIKEGCRINLDTSGGFFTFTGNNCRFLAPDSKSSSSLKDENIEFSDNNIEINIQNKSGGNSTARFRFRKLPQQPGMLFWFDGIVFRKI